ncbi:unnamed protein product [Parnassius apollo]|uniref:(apollo) hypothetical protein n=1 Tax=Parnassius apollo TaxID=110799 RepID=A0A8S3W151_PARAO|nr:unnamed protein product [Parnassius apollo]
MKILSITMNNVVNAKRKKPLSPFSQNIGFPMEIGGQIKSEPRDSPSNMRSPPQHVYPPYEHEPVQPWPMDMPPSLNMAGPSQVNQYAGQGMTWMDQSYLQAQHLQPSSPMQAMSPHMQPLSPHMQPLSPHMQPLSPHMQQLSPMGHSPLSPAMGHASPAMGHISPGLNHAQGQYVQSIDQQNLIQQDMDVTSNSTPSISKLLEVQGQGEEIRLSSDLSFPMCGADLSDSLKELSTKDLLDNTEWPPHGGG